MNGDISVEIGSALPYAVDSLLKLFGRDALSVASRNRLTNRVRLSLQEASTIQAVGMSRPVPIDTLYQPTRLRTEHFHRQKVFSVKQALSLSENLVIWGDPGSGKSVFLKYAYLTLIKQESDIPLLFQLRKPDSIEDLQTLISDIKDSSKSRSKPRSIKLLIDGYDEIPLEDRRKVSEILRQFNALNCGSFLMTCRTYYELVDIVSRQLWIEPFSSDDALKYVTTLLRTFESKADPKLLLKELKERNFGDFLESPLMLTLVCILKTSALPQLPRNTLGLIRRAIDTLTLRWDQSRGIAREGIYSVDGEERVQCLMRIAFAFRQPIGPEGKALECTREHMELNHRRDVNPHNFLIETAQWYGLFVPVSDAQWVFTHRTIHDFLAARHWVETGRFSSNILGNLDWNSRTSYAACLSPDATFVICQSLEKSGEFTVFLECISNAAPFNSKDVALALIKRFNSSFLSAYTGHTRDGKSIKVIARSNILAAGSDGLVSDLYRISGESPPSPGRDILYVLSKFEVEKRNLTNTLEYKGLKSGLMLHLFFGHDVKNSSEQTLVDS